MAHGIADRTVWVADSFEGVPPATLEQGIGIDISWKSLPILAVSLEEVKALFSRYKLLDEQVKFLQGWFKDTLPSASIDRLAVLGVDGDLYEATMNTLNPLYGKVSPGGFVIIDVYHSCHTCRQAVDEFRTTHHIRDKLIAIDQHAVY